MTGTLLLNQAFVFTPVMPFEIFGNLNSRSLVAGICCSICTSIIFTADFHFCWCIFVSGSRIFSGDTYFSINGLDPALGFPEVWSTLDTEPREPCTLSKSTTRPNPWLWAVMARWISMSFSSAYVFTCARAISLSLAPPSANIMWTLSCDNYRYVMQPQTMKLNCC